MTTSDENLLREHRRREAIRSKCILNVTFPPESKESLIGLGGYLKLTKSNDKSILKGQLIFASEEEAKKTKQMILDSNDESIKIEPAEMHLPEDRINWTSLKLLRVPKSVSDEEIVSVFTGAISIIRKPERRMNFIWSSRNKYQNEVARDEVIVGFPSKQQCIKRFMACEDLSLGGEKIITLFGQKNVKVPKTKRKKMKDLKRQLNQKKREQRKLNKLKASQKNSEGKGKPNVNK